MASDSKAVRVVLVEDHAQTRDKLVRLLREHPTKVELVGAFPSAEAMLSAEGALTFHVALIDVRLPVMSGIELIQRLTTLPSERRYLVLSSFDDERSVLEAVRAGAFGYLLKDEPSERILYAIQEAMEGANPMSSRVVGVLMQQASRTASNFLTEREFELASALSEGLSYAECAGRMGIRLGTVQDYVKTLYRKVDVQSKDELKAWMSRYTKSAV